MARPDRDRVLERPGARGVRLRLPRDGHDLDRNGPRLNLGGRPLAADRAGRGHGADLCAPRVGAAQRGSGHVRARGHARRATAGRRCHSRRRRPGAAERRLHRFSERRRLLLPPKARGPRPMGKRSLLVHAPEDPGGGYLRRPDHDPELDQPLLRRHARRRSDRSHPIRRRGNREGVRSRRTRELTSRRLREPTSSGHRRVRPRTCSRSSTAAGASSSSRTRRWPAATSSPRCSPPPDAA